MTYLTIILLALATWRLSNMLADTNQEGPFRLLARLRHLAGVRFDAYSEPYASNNFAEGLLCVYCSSIWFGIGFVILFYSVPIAAFWIALPLALSALAILIQKIGGFDA